MKHTPNPDRDFPDPNNPHQFIAGYAFMKNHETPEYLIDGIVQRGRLYACTSLTGHGKTAVWLFNACMIHTGRMIGTLDTSRGNVLYLAGENPTDLQARMWGMHRTLNIPINDMPFVLPTSFPLTEDEAELLAKQTHDRGIHFAMIVGDTAASFFPGDNDNDNVQVGVYARSLRTLTEKCLGKPAVVFQTHPTKNAAPDNLLPRGGSAFLNELDGNLTLWSQAKGEVTSLHWQGKIRGTDFSPLGYRLRNVPTGFLDWKHRPEITIVAEPMSEEAAADHRKQTVAHEDVVLKAMRDHPEWSYNQIARDVGWINDEDEPLKPRVQRAVENLARDKLIFKPRANDRWELSDKGRNILNKKYPNGEDN